MAKTYIARLILITFAATALALAITLTALSAIADAGLMQ